MRRTSLQTIFSLAALVSLVVVPMFVPLRAFAESGGLSQLPTSRKRVPNGLAMDIDTRWVDGTGYRPIRCTMINWPRGPATVDRTFRIELEPTINQWRRFDPKVTGTVELKRGQRTAEIEIYCPQSHWWGGLTVRVFEGSVEHREFRATVTVSQMGRSDWSEAVPRCLFVSSLADRSAQQLINQHDFPRWDILIESIPNNEDIGYQSFTAATDDAQISQTIQMAPLAAIIPPHRIPKQWIGLSGVDFIFMSAEELTLLKKNQPPKFESLQQWLVVGGHLCISDVGSKFERLKNIETELGMVASPPDDPESLWAPLPDAGYSLVYQREIRPTNVYGGRLPTTEPDEYIIDESSAFAPVPIDSPQPPNSVSPQSPGSTPASPSATSSPSSGPPPGVVAPLVRTVGQGRVFLIEDSSSWENWYYTNWIFNSLPAERLAWFQKYGMSLNRHNHGFWNWSIRGIGRVPVFLFLFVITVFSVFIGPVNFVIAIKRLKRYYLVLITVPLISVITTIGLFSYGILRDGLGTKVRRRAYVELDQVTGRSHSWSRQTYYPSIAPSGGARFPLNSAVYPMDAAPVRPSKNQHSLRWVGSQQLASGYIHSRTLSQFMVVHPTKSTAANINLKTNGGKLTAKNELGGKITHLVVCDKRGKLHAGQSIENGATLTLKATDGKNISQAMREALLIQNLEHEVTDGLVRTSRRYWYEDDVDTDLPMPDDETSLMETEIARIRSGVVKTLRPGTYVAMMSSSTTVPVGISGSEDRDSMIVVRGSW